FTLTDENTLQIHYTALSDKPTVVNLSNHAYFNLCGHDKGDISSHWLKINAGYYAPVDMMCIPTGEVSPAQNTPFDFMSFHRIGERIEAKYSQLEIANGYDHN
ncbi:MAG: galactose-1-epimerase, partial [Clostridiaceae bacterium]|nr:galactose-1-epimerase [Clostridiaceae bacterium]